MKDRASLSTPPSGTHPKSERVIRSDAPRTCYIALDATLIVLPIPFGVGLAP